MTSELSSISCCCKDDKPKACCRTFSIRQSCPKYESDLENCTVRPAGTTYIELVYKQLSCVPSPEDCNCDSPPTPGSFGSGLPPGDIVACSASYLNLECNSEEAVNSCNNNNAPKICTGWLCGPCAPAMYGCTLVGADEPCPPPPAECPENPCCNPEVIWCCGKSVSNNCITGAACSPFVGVDRCPPTEIVDGTGIIWSEVLSCSQCEVPPDYTHTVVRGCCGTCDPECRECAPCPAGAKCCACAPDTDPPCAMCRCYGVCDPGNNPNIEQVDCQCPIVEEIEGCWTYGGCAVSTTNFTGNNYAAKPNYAEARYTSGFIRNDSGLYDLNSILLFGYGYKHL